MLASYLGNHFLTYLFGFMSLVILSHLHVKRLIYFLKSCIANIFNWSKYTDTVWAVVIVCSGSTKATFLRHDPWCPLTVWKQMDHPVNQRQKSVWTAESSLPLLLLIQGSFLWNPVRFQHQRKNQTPGLHELVDPLLTCCECSGEEKDFHFLANWWAGLSSVSCSFSLIGQQLFWKSSCCNCMMLSRAAGEYFSVTANHR